MSQMPAEGDAYLDAEGHTTPLGAESTDASVRDAIRLKKHGGELSRIDPQPIHSSRPSSAVEKKIEKLARKRVKKRQEFRQHLAVFLSVMALLWFIWLVTGGGFPWPGIPMLAWGIGITAHWLDLRHHETEQSEIDKEIGRIRGHGGLDS